MNDANADLVNELRIPPDANDETIQEALLRLFNAQVREQVRDQSVSVAEEGQVLRSRQAVQRGPRWTMGGDAVTTNEITKMTTVQCLNVQNVNSPITA